MLGGEGLDGGGPADVVDEEAVGDLFFFLEERERFSFFLRFSETRKEVKKASSSLLLPSLTLAPFRNPGTLDPFLALFRAACHAASTAEAGTVTVSSTAAPLPSSLRETSTSAEEGAAAVETEEEEEEARREEVAKRKGDRIALLLLLLLLVAEGRAARVGSWLVGSGEGGVLAEREERRAK